MKLTITAEIIRVVLAEPVFCYGKQLRLVFVRQLPKYACDLKSKFVTINYACC